MTYKTVVNAMEALIPQGSLPELQPGDVAQGDYDLLNESHKYVVILDFGGLDFERAKFGSGYSDAWDILLTLAVPLTTSKQAHDDMADLRQEILTQIRTNPSLTQETVQINAGRGAELPDVIEWGGNSWLIEELRFVVQELLVEYDA